jgi:F-type H+-transporting ATPase subunit b
MLDTSTSVLAAEVDGGAVELLFPAWPELIAGIIAFGLVFFFVRTWVWPKLGKVVEMRQEALAGEYTAAERAKAEAESLLEDYRKQLAEAKAEGNRIMEEARAAAEQVRAEIIAKAEGDAEKIRAKARDEAASEKSRALADAKVQVGDLSVDLAGRIVGESLDADSHKALIDRYLADLERL